MDSLSLRQLLGVFLAGGLGACLRVLLTTLIDARSLRQPYLGTLCVNLLGCFLIGAVAGSMARHPLRPIVVGGLLGGFTTYSSFAMATWDLWRAQRLGALALQLGVHVAGGIACVGLGVAAGAWLVAAQQR